MKLSYYIRTLFSFLLPFYIIASCFCQESSKTITKNNTNDIILPKKDKTVTKNLSANDGFQKKKNSKHNSIGKELTASTRIGEFKINFYTRVQTRFDGSLTANNGLNDFERVLRFRRVRFKFDGFVFSPKIGYKVELDALKGQVLDAVIKWHVTKRFSVWAGQTKVMGNRERVISSRNLQFVDRSLLNKRYNLDRDLGIQFHHNFKIGKTVIVENLGVFQGEGKNYVDKAENINSKGLSYTGRIEFLPFGKFTSKGDYSSADLKREPKPKLSIGITYDFNSDAILSGGQLGNVMKQGSDLKTLIFDAMFKYKGFSFLGEYMDKTSSSSVFQTEDKIFKTGIGLNLQAGYLFKSNWEIATRYTSVTPEKETLHNNQKEYTMAVSKYIVGHKIKVQSDISLQTQDTKNDQFIFRLQLEFDF